MTMLTPCTNLGAMFRNPPALVLRLANVVLLAMALYEEKASIVRSYESKILAELNAGPAQRFARCLPAGMKVLDPKRAYLLSEEDRTVFHRRCEEERVKAKLRVNDDGACPAQEAEQLLLKAKIALAEAVQPYSGLDVEVLRWNLQALDAIVDLTVTGLSDHLRTQQLLAEMCGVQFPSGGAHPASA